MCVCVLFGCRFASSLLQRAGDHPAPRVMHPAFNLQTSTLINLMLPHHECSQALPHSEEDVVTQPVPSRGKPLQTEGRPLAQDVSAPCGPRPRSVMGGFLAAGSVPGIAGLGHFSTDKVAKQIRTCSVLYN